MKVKNTLKYCLKIEDYWKTSIGETNINLSEDLRQSLIKIIINDGANIFEVLNDPNYKGWGNFRHIETFKGIAHELFEDYLLNVYDINSDEITIESKAFGNHQMYGGRTYPHYHNDYDVVLVHYLTIGEEFKGTINSTKYSDGVYLKNDFDIVPLVEEDKIHKTEPFEERQGYYAIQGDTKFRKSKLHTINEGENYEEKFPLQGSGSLIICDPRVGINNLFSNKAIAKKPVKGMTLIHPANLWHESNTFTGNGFRVNIVVMFKVLKKRGE